MRVSTRGAYLAGLQAIQRLQSALDYTQRQISSGRRILNPSDDPIASARAIEFSEAISRLGQFDRNATIVTNRLSQEEAALSSINDTLQRVRELALQGNNATQSNESRALIAVEIREHLDHLVQLANQQDGNGSYLFAGNLEDIQPVTQTGSTYTYNGDQGQRLIQVGEGRQVADSDPGSAVFFRVRNGNGAFSAIAADTNSGSGVVGASSVTDPTLYDQDTYTIRFNSPSDYTIFDGAGSNIGMSTYTSGDTIAFRGIELSMTGDPATGDFFTVAPSSFQSIFDTVDQLATAMEQPVTDDASRAALNNDMNFGLLNIEQALGNILDVRTQVGARLTAIESQVDSNGAQALTLQTALAEIRDLDYVEAISRLSSEAATLEAAQATFVRTQQLSLFNYF